MVPSAAKIAANRRNGAKSTGPKTLGGKKASSINATRHAVLSVTPVLPGVERAEEWAAHLEATVASLAPVGHLEALLAERVAALFWRLGRVTRHEVSVATLAMTETPEDLSWSEAWKEFGKDPRVIREAIEGSKRAVKRLQALATLPDDASVEAEAAEFALETLAARLEVDLEEADLEEVPKEAGEAGWGNWPGWTRGHVVAVGRAIVAASESQDEDPLEAWAQEEQQTRQLVTRAREALADLEAAIRLQERTQTIMPPEPLESVSRYEAHLERCLFRALHELQRLQASRTGTGTAPMALDLDVSVGPRMGRPGPRDIDGEIVEP